MPKTLTFSESSLVLSIHTRYTEVFENRNSSNLKSRNPVLTA